MTSWRKDDTRLHVDSFPSNPMRGRRLLRVFHNLNPNGQPRSWRVGEPFEDFARRFLPAIARPLPGSAAVLHALHITKSRRSAYDHYMLQLHDRVKADMAYQRAATWQQWAEPSRRATPRLKWVIPFVGGITLVVCIAFPISQSLGLPPDQVGAVLGPLLVVPGIFAFGFVVWQYSGARGAAKRAVASRIRVACPTCGAMGGTPRDGLAGVQARRR